jgi:hypothetical protein
MTIYCLYHSASGASHILPLEFKADAGPRYAFRADANAMLSDTTVPRETDWHCTPVLGMSTILRGYLDIEANKASPERVRLVAGDVLIVIDNNSGPNVEGHKGHSHGPNGVGVLMLKLNVEDIPALAASFSNWPQDIVF